MNTPPESSRYQESESNPAHQISRTQVVSQFTKITADSSRGVLELDSNNNLVVAIRIPVESHHSVESALARFSFFRGQILESFNALEMPTLLVKFLRSGVVLLATTLVTKPEKYIPEFFGPLGTAKDQDSDLDLKSQLVNYAEFLGEKAPLRLEGDGLAINDHTLPKRRRSTSNPST